MKTEKNKKNNFWLLLTLKKHCSFAYLQYSCPMNSAPGVGPQKKKNSCNAKHMDADVIQMVT